MVYEMGKNIALKEFVEGFNKCEVVIAWPENNKCKKPVHCNAGKENFCFAP